MYIFLQLGIVRKAFAPTSRLYRMTTHVKSDYIIGHDAENKEFYIKLKSPDGSVSDGKALLQYCYVANQSIDMYHTEVPPAFRGKGIAKQLAKAALNFAVKEELKVMLSCTYLQKYVEDNPLPKYTERLIPTDGPPV